MGMQTLRGMHQAEEAGRKIKAMMAADGKPFRLYFYMSPYRRSSQARPALSMPFHSLNTSSTGVPL
jgi:hypothetical protein